MSEIKIKAHEENKPEIRVNFTVYLHANDQAEMRDRVSQIRHHIEEALADEDNDLVSFTYPEVRQSYADKFGNPTAEPFANE